ncbi:694_t:CDS:2 [Ambispora leptoticha]|uniref:694_t:CDS:1 n=1 Tax=Ambispora leptoticha TaxID=144679 RepID=A0A9N8WCP0_9GLOM|nr:694_t:CDS:2 [Ambispora leptoticha]
MSSFRPFAVAKKQLTTDDNQPERDEEVAYEKVAFVKIVDYITSKTTNLNENDVLSFNLHVRLDTAQHDVKNMIKLIVDEIEGLSDIIEYSQLYCELEHEFKESNQKRMDHFDCYDKLTIHVDMPAEEMIVRFYHNIQYEKPVDIQK